MDGTLVDSRQAIVAATQHAVAQIGGPSPTAAATRALIGLPLRTMLARLAPPDLPSRQLDALVASYKAAYPGLARQHERSFSGIPELLDALTRSGQRLAIATSKSTRGAHSALARHDWGDLFHPVLGADAVKHPKPAPDMVLKILRETGRAPDQVVMVGDTTFDVEMGCAAGVRAVGVSWGSHTPEQLRGAGAERVVHTVEELGQVLS